MSAVAAGSQLDHRAALLAPTRADASIAAQVLQEAAIPAAICATFSEILDVIEEGVGIVVLIEEYFTPAESARLQESLARQPPWSSVPFVVLTNRAARGLRSLSALESLPNSILLERPVAIAGLLSAIRAGLATRVRQYEIRDLLTAAQRASEERARLHAAAEEARSAAIAANTMKDEFLAVLSHELRTPLNAILGWVRLLQMGALDETRAAQAIETIERNTRMQAQLIEDLLDVSRIISGTLRLDVQSVDPVQVIEQALATVAPAAEAKGVRVNRALDPSAGPVAGDPARLQQVVWNLLSNSVKFTPKNGRIQVQLERTGSAAQITVSDTGQGIAREFLPHVFERFKQADGSVTRKHGGLGLGLAIVRQLVELHGGTVQASSEGEGKGASFQVRLPLMPLRPVAVQSSSNAEQHTTWAGGTAVPSLAGLSVLIIDDEQDSRDVLLTTLRQYDAEVFAAESVSEGLRLFVERRPHLVVSDIGMPGEDGYAFVRQMRKLESAQGIWTPAVALTAYARAEDRKRVLAAGFQIHMAKPVDPLELVFTLASLARTVSR